MSPDQLKHLETQLWEAADQLRANSKLTATEYSMPVLGLIFLRHAYNRFKKVKEEVEKGLPVHPQRGTREIKKEDFQEARAIFLPEKARWEYLAGLPEGEDVGQILNDAMKAIENEYEVLDGVLPKEYTIFEKELLVDLLRIFNTEMLNDVGGDVFGRIYEYFLNEFAKKGAQEGGEFFTPPSLVNTIVNIIQPDHGTILDPACGSAGMYIQTGHFLEAEGKDPSKQVTFFGQEKASTNIKLAKMNLAVHGLDGDILQGNTFYEDKHDKVGECDFVMANPPFNVDKVDKGKESVKNDPRLPFGLPKNDNANYLWIQYFYSYLNETGRAGFVMASSASDAGHSEKDIRQKLVETGGVDVMVSIGPKFFYTRGLPCTLWFFDRGKEKDEERRNQTLMLDLREVYRKVSSNLHDFTPEHLLNIAAIVGLYRGSDEDSSYALATYAFKATESLWAAKNAMTEIQKITKEIKVTLETLLNKEQSKELGELSFEDLNSLGDSGENITDNSILGEIQESASSKELAEVFLVSKGHSEELKKGKKQVNVLLKAFGERIKGWGRDKELRKTNIWKDDILKIHKELEKYVTKFNVGIDDAVYFIKEGNWLGVRFPEGKYLDVPGLCKMVSKIEIEENDFSLTPGRYVGVGQSIDEDFDFEDRIGEIKNELQVLNEEAANLANEIQQDLNEMGL
jgi:type I restriction enzyme M protein